MQQTFFGRVGTKDVVIKGETLKEAMEIAGYDPITKYKSGNKYVGQLSDGRRYSFNYQARKRFNEVH